VETTVQHLTKQITPQGLAYKALDYEEPLSFREWKNSRTSVIPTQEYILYNQYLTDWYAQKQKANNNTDQRYQTRINYLSLLKELQLFFSNDEKNKWYEIVNFNDDNEIINAIPYFAKKLKEIAIYYINVRKKLKNTKLQYNLGGTNTGFELEIQEQILSNYTKSEYNTLQIPNVVVGTLPDLDDIKKNLVVKVEEIYDDHEYQDQSLSVPLSTYYNTKDNLTTNFLNTKNIQLSSNEWVYENAVAFNDDFFDTEYSLNLAENFLKKYSGTDRSVGEIATATVNSSIYNIPLNTGDNLFIWPYGTYKPSTIPTTRFQRVALSASNITDLATAGVNLETSDIVFTESKAGIKGAWLELQQYSTEEKYLKTKFKKNTKTEFRFPYPSFGLSGIGMEWSGPGFEYLPEFNYLKDEYKQLIETAYWNFETALTSVEPIKLQDTSLINQRAHASVNYSAADKVTVRENPPYNTEPLYTGESQKAWLYKFTKTDLPIKPGDTTTIYWPYERLEDQTIPSYYPETSFICNPLKLSNIPLSYEIAAATFESADKIYKLKSIEDTIETATECAWLSSASELYSYSKAIIPPQPSLSIIATSGKAVKFIWQGDNLTDLNDVFKPVKHQRDCPFTSEYSTIEYHNFDRCTCNATKFTPFGSPSLSVDSNINATDIIVECTDYNNIDTFDITKWRDRDGLDYKQSLNFARFKTDHKTGFEAGKWVTEIYNGIPRLKKGGVYLYLRAKIDMPAAGTSSLPTYVLRYKYPLYNTQGVFTWVAANKQADGTWKSADTPSDMILREKDILIYSRANSVVSTISGTELVTETVAENRGNIWANYDYISIVNSSDQTSYITQTVYVNYPDLNFTNPLSASLTLGNGVPPINKKDVLSIKRWYLIDPSGIKRAFDDTEVLSFTPSTPGIYRVEVEVLSGRPEAINRVPNAGNTSTTFNISAFTYTWSPETTITYLFTGIPPITAIDFQRHVTSLTAISTPHPGFIYNTDLYGWDYSAAYQQTVSVPGAKPFWAESYTGRAEQTRYGGVPDWSGQFRVFDEHNIVTQPRFSDIELQTGQFFEYERKGNSTLIWEQPLTQKIEINKKVWKDLIFNFNDTVNLEYILNNYGAINTLTVTPLSTNSSLSFTNIEDNSSVSILYRALTPFTWSITATPLLEEYTVTEKDIQTVFTAERPWNQFVNRFTPTTVLAPTLESIYTKKDVGGYFIPNNLGVSVYNSKNFTYTLNLTSTDVVNEFVPPDFFYGGRGSTKTDNTIPYTQLNENAQWLKESFNSGVLAGNVDRDVAKQYPKFVPYQSSTESKITKQTNTGITNSKLTPWGGKEEKTWIDNTITPPTNKSGLYNPNSWVEQHILQSGEKRIYNWASDIYGNQFVLLKDIKDVLLYEQKNITGELWVQKASNIVQPAYKALSQVFDTYKGLALYNELTGNGIRKIDVFFDTLYIETSSTILLEKLNYDYAEDNIYSFVDSSHAISLLYPHTMGLKREYTTPGLTGVSVAQVGDTWFLPEQKIVLLSICELSAHNVMPHLYELDIVNETFSKVFPI
jgi:hypothetical protein